MQPERTAADSLADAVELEFNSTQPTGWRCGVRRSIDAYREAAK
jgi:hypothetical protein